MIHPFLQTRRLNLPFYPKTTSFSWLLSCFQEKKHVSHPPDLKPPTKAQGWQQLECVPESGDNLQDYTAGWRPRNELRASAPATQHSLMGTKVNSRPSFARSLCFFFFFNIICIHIYTHTQIIYIYTIYIDFVVKFIKCV